MWSFIKNIFNSRTVTKGLDLIDKSKFTEQEKAKAKLEYFKQMTGGLSSVNRRILVWVVALPYTSLAFAYGVYAFFNFEHAKQLVSNLQATHLGEAFWSIIGFYFVLEGVRKLKGSKD